MFRFTIRDIVWLTIVVAIAIAWGVQRVELDRAKTEASRHKFDLYRLELLLKENGYRVMWDEEMGMIAVGMYPPLPDPTRLQERPPQLSLDDLRLEP